MIEKIIDKFYYLKRWYSRVISEKYYNLKYGISNIIHWFPVIWNDRGWDFSYMFGVWEKKFDLMIKSFERGKTHVCGCEKQIKRMKICKEICRRLKDDWYYHENTFMFHDRRWGDLDFKPIGNKEYNITRENVFTPQDDELERKQSLILFKREDMRKNADMDLLMRYINKYWRQWWW